MDATSRRAVLDALGRRRIAPDLHLEPGAGDVRWIVVSGPEREEWRTRDPGDQLRLAFPGTAVLLDDEILEVTRHHPPDAPGVPHRYELCPWEDRFPLRSPPQELSIEAEAARREARRLAFRNRRRGDLANWLGIVLSLLPGAEQERLRRVYGYEPVFWTRVSAIVWTLVLLAVAIRGWDFWLSGATGVAGLFAILVLIVEQFFRRGKAAVGEPCGSILGHLFRLVVPAPGTDRWGRPRS